MKKTNFSTLPVGVAALLLVGGSAFAATLLVQDQYNVANSGSGFGLGSGVNSGINPPTTRLTGSGAANLRYIKTAGAKANSAHYITNSTKFGISRVSTDSSTISLSSGSGAYDFSPVLNSLAATPELPAVYECTIKIANGAAGVQRCSFAISATTGTAGDWDFAIQLYHAATTDTAYTLQKRVGAAASKTGGAINLPIGTVGTYSNEVAFLIRVTDAGPESDANFNSRVQVSLDGGTTWSYDTSLDADLQNGWRFPTGSRFIYWDIAGGAGPVTYDDFSLTWLSGPTTGVRTWTGAGADANWSSGANWGGVVPGTGDMLVFNGTTRQSNTNDLSGLTVPWLTFKNGGFALYGNLLTIGGPITNLAGNNTFGMDLAWASSGVKSWSIASGTELLLNNTNSVEVSGDHILSGGGTLRQKLAMSMGQTTTVTPAMILNEGQHVVDGGTFVSRGGYRIGSSATAATGAQTVVTNGAVFNLTVSAANVRVGDSANRVTSQFSIDHSTVAMTYGTIGIPWVTGATGLVSQVGGVVSGNRISFSESGAGQGTYSIKDGVLETLQIRRNTNTGMATIIFDNATLRTTAGCSNSTFFTGLNLAQIEAGGLVLDGSENFTIGQNLTGTGGLVKSNSNTVTLTGDNTYAGTTVLKAGKLILPAGKTHGTISTENYSELEILAQPGKGLTNSSLTLGNGGVCTLNFDLNGAYLNPDAPLMTCSSLSANGVVTVNLANALALNVGRIVLIDYSGSIGGTGFDSFVLNNAAGATATLVNNTANSSIDLNITSVSGYRWTGAVSWDWDTRAQNWLSFQNGLPSAYVDFYPVEFGDSAATGNVWIVNQVYPTVVTVSNNALPYVFSGAAISASRLIKSGEGSLTRVEGGADAITEVQIDAGSYVFTNQSPGDFNVLSGAGTFIKQGPAMLSLTKASANYDGPIVVQGGLLKVGVAGALGTTNGSTTIANGGTLDVNDIQSPGEPVIVSGAGYDGQGAITELTGVGGVQHNLTDVTLAGDTVFGCASGGRWDIRVRSGSGPGPGLQGNSHNLTKVGLGTVSIACQRNLGANTPYWAMNLGDIVIKEGLLTLAESLTPGNPDRKIAVGDGATLGTYDLGLTNPILRNIYLTNASITAGGNAGDTNILNGAIEVTGTVSLRPNDATLLINGAIGGTGSLSIGGTSVGLALLNGNNTYPGDTTVTNSTFGGNGVLAGNLVMLGGILSPGMGVGTLTVNGNATLATTNVFELNRTLSAKNDRLVVGGTLTLGGTLQVVLRANPQPGDVYPLFNKGGAGAFANILLPDISALPGAMSWDTTKLTTDGILKVNGTALPPTIGSVVIIDGDFVFSGSGGIEGNPYCVLTSTNVAAPMADWTRVATNVFGPGGTFSCTNVLNPALSASFFRLQVQ